MMPALLRSKAYMDIRDEPFGMAVLLEMRL